MKTLKNIIIPLILFTISLHAQSGVIKGRVVDSESNEPLAFVNILVEGTDYGAASDLDGNFIILALDPGFYKLRASYIGYETTQSAEIQVNNAKQAYVDIKMTASALNLEAVTVRPNSFIRTEEAPLSVNEIRVSEIETTPGGNRDLSKIIQSFPGVGSTPSFRNDIIVRGGGSNEVSFYIDGIEIPNLNHFATQGASGGATGIINPDFIQSVNYYSGAFPANRGDAMSGVFEFTQKNGNSDNRNWRAVVGASDLALTTDGPVTDNTTMIFSVRRSYLQFLFNALGLPFLPTYTDYQFKSRTLIDEKNTLTVVSIGALDEFSLNTGLKDPDEYQRYIISYLPYQEQWNYTTGITYTHFMGKSFQNYIYSRNMLNNSSYKYLENDDSSENNKILDYLSQEIENKFRFENTWRDKGWKVNTGLNLQYSKYNNSTYQKVLAGDALQEVNYASDFDMWFWGLFAQVSRPVLNDRLTLSAGLRMDANSYSSTMSNMFSQFAPRLSASYELSKVTSLNFNTGRYYQAPPYTAMGYRDLSGDLVNKTNDLKYIYADHVVAGIDHRLNLESKLSFELFHKTYHQYPFSVRNQVSLANIGADFGVVGNEEVTSTGEGRAVGGELLLRYSPENGPTNIIAAYTYVNSEFKDASGKYIPSAWDSRHIFTLTATTAWGEKKSWRGGFKWRYVGGLPYTPFDLDNSALVTVWDTQGQAYPDYSLFNTERFSPFHQLDVRIDKTFNFANYSLNLYFDVQNLYNFQAEQQSIPIRRVDENGMPVILNPDAPVEEQRYDLYELQNTAGTVLPTIGIILDF